MGRRFSKRKNAPPRKERDPNEVYAEVQKENVQMEEYYKAQNIMSEEEWPVFWNHLKVTLPTTFRITGTRRFVPLCFKRKPYYLEIQKGSHCMGHSVIKLISI